MARRKKQEAKAAEPAPKPSAKGSKRLVVGSDTPPPGVTLSEGATEIEDVLDREPEPAEERDPEAVRERMDRLRERGDIDSAVDAIGDALELDPDELAPPEEEDDGGEPESDPADYLDVEEVGDRLVTVKVDGTETAVPLSEALAGYQRQADYTRKTQQLAAERQEVGKVRDQAQQLAGAYARRLDVLQRAGIAMTPQQRQAIERAWTEVNAELEALQAHALSERLPEEGRKLAEALGWDSDEKATAGRQALAETAYAYGYTPEDLSGVTDHRVLLILDDARKWREAQSGISDAKDAARRNRRESPTLKPGTRQGKGDSAKREARKRRERLAQTGNILDAAKAIEGLIS